MMTTRPKPRAQRQPERAIKIDLFLEFASPPAAALTAAQVFENGLSLARAADRAGLGAVWLAEHHFLGDYSNAAAPDLLLAAIARETRTIGLGFAIIPLPLHDSVRVAERLATLDAISNGRVMWGVGRGVTPTELGAFRVNPASSRETFLDRYAELISILRTGKATRSGLTLEVRPRPESRLARGWMAAVSPESYELAAELGLDVMAGPFKPWPFVARDFERFRALHPDGRTSFALACYCEPDHRAARRRAGPGIVWAFENILKISAPFLKQRTAGYEHYRKLGLASGLLEKALSLPVLELMGLAAIGDPEHVGKRLSALAHAGVDRVQLVIGGGDLDTGRLEACVELLAKDVVPRVELGACGTRAAA